MRKALNTLLWVAGIIVITYLLSLLLNVWIYGTYVSRETEEKYIRNLPDIEAYSKEYIYPSVNVADSIAFCGVVGIEIPFVTRWYIYNEGLVNPKSKLSKKLDSIAEAYQKQLK